jgi:hypothetical protein
MFTFQTNAQKTFNFGKGYARESIRVEDNQEDSLFDTSIDSLNKETLPEFVCVNAPFSPLSPLQSSIHPNFLTEFIQTYFTDAAYSHAFYQGPQCLWYAPNPQQSYHVYKIKDFKNTRSNGGGT